MELDDDRFLLRALVLQLLSLETRESCSQLKKLIFEVLMAVKAHISNFLIYLRRPYSKNGYKVRYQCAGSCEYGNEPSGSIKFWECFG
jgi:hypothetical protein